MPKQVETEAREDNRASEAMKKSKFEALMGKVKNAKKTASTASKNAGELVAAAVESENCHRGAFNLAVRLDGMDPVKRAEFLFHFDTYRKYRAHWDAQQDMLGDRKAGADDEADQGDGAEADASGDASEETRDLRPRHLRQPGASAADGEDGAASTRKH